MMIVHLVPLVVSLDIRDIVSLFEGVTNMHHKALERVHDNLRTRRRQMNLSYTDTGFSCTNLATSYTEIRRGWPSLVDGGWR